MSENPRILCVHQGGELYGSDRSFLQCVTAIREGWPGAHIKVVLAVDGPLRAHLAKVADEVVTRSLSVLRLANPLATLGKSTIASPYYIGRAAADIRAADLAYINTTVISDYMIAARFFAEKCVIHAREIPKPKAMPVIGRLLRWSNAGVIFNSQATARAFALPQGQRQAVIYNGVEAASLPRPPAPGGAFGAERPLRIAMLGRVNDWKGQDLLVEALALLDDADRARVSARIVGSAYLDRPEPIDDLREKISSARLDDVVTLEPFKDDPGEVYRWADICTVPSRLPEPFGRVAIEAMAEARPVIASAHGGPLEIVENGQSGWLFKPNDADDFARTIRACLADPARIEQGGRQALARFKGMFSEEILSQRLRATLAAWGLGESHTAA